ncbi:MAG: histidine--tRNA ligase [Gemmatimonadales bacterium]|nr:histidine--tRNA ligase [Gemmatimonadales bacterium]
MQPKALPGFRDFYPADFALRAYIFRTWRTVATRYGFEEYDGPPLEPLQLYTAKSGEEIAGQLYNFTDKGGREVALRPEMTPTLARMVAARANGLRKPIRWFSLPQLFRYERQQRGRLREHFQLNCDLIGEPGPLGDAEIIALAVDALRAFGLGPADFRVRLSDRRLLNGILRSLGFRDDQMGLAYQALDKLGRSEYAGRKHALADAGVPADRIANLDSLRHMKALSEVEERFGDVGAAVAPLRVTWDALGAIGLGGFVDLDLTIVRGLAYYTGTVFELFDAQAELRAICGGGRYDDLLQALGGVDLPALGFGMGDVVLTELLRDRGLIPEEAPSIDVFLAGITDDDLPHVLALAHELRDAGVRAEYALSYQAVGKQLKLADARGARLAIVIGPDDRARGEVMLKDLAGKTQSSVARDAVLSHVAGIVAGFTTEAQRTQRAQRTATDRVNSTPT